MTKLAGRADDALALIARFQSLNGPLGMSDNFNGIAKTASKATSALTLNGEGTGNILAHTRVSIGNVGTSTEPTARSERSSYKQRVADYAFKIQDRNAI